MPDSSEFLFEPPQAVPTASEGAHTAMQLAALAERLALEDRTLVQHPTGRPENVAEHSFMVGIVAPAVAELMYPDLDANLIARFATIHDAVEAYVGDTPTHEIDAAGLHSKQSREEKGFAQLCHDYASMPGFVRLATDYEEQKIPEARFVRVIDKWMPLLIHFVEGGKTLQGHFTADELIENSDDRAARLLEEYPEFADLIEIRKELSRLATTYLYKPAREPKDTV